MTTAEITVGGYVARFIRAGTEAYPMGVTYVRERRNGSGTIITLAVDATGVATIRERLTRRVFDFPKEHTKDQRVWFARVIETLNGLAVDSPAPEPIPEPVVEPPAPAPVIEATIEAEIAPVPPSDPSAVIDPKIVALQVRTTLRMFWRQIPTLRGAQFMNPAIVAAVTDRLLALGAESSEVGATLGKLSAGGVADSIFDALVLRAARDIYDPKPKPSSTPKAKATRAMPVMKSTIAKAEAAEARLAAALATDPKARNIAALKAVATKLRREATATQPSL